MALATLARVAPCLVVAAPRGMRLPELLPAPGEFADDEEPAGFRCERVDDLAPEEGPLAGLVPALERAVERGASRAFVLSVDLPRFTPAELACLAAPLAGRPGAVAVVPRTPGGLEPLLSCVKPDAVAPAFRAAYEGGERAVHRAFTGLGPGRLVELDTTDPVAWPAGPGRVAGVNTPEDYLRVFGRPLVREPGPA